MIRYHDIRLYSAVRLFLILAFVVLCGSAYFCCKAYWRVADESKKQTALLAEQTEAIKEGIELGKIVPVPYGVKP